VYYAIGIRGRGMCRIIFYAFIDSVSIGFNTINYNDPDLIPRIEAEYYKTLFILNGDTLAHQRFQEIHNAHQ
jgi:hypothetical protein